MAKRTYHKIGYYNEVEDIRYLAGKTAEQVVASMKDGEGSFFTTDGEEVIDIEDGETLKEYMMLTSDSRYLIVTDVPNESDAEGLEDNDDNPLFVDIYALGDRRWITFHLELRSKKKTVSFSLEVEEEGAEIIASHLSNINAVKDVNILVRRPMDPYRIYINAEGNIESRSDRLATDNETIDFIWSLKVGRAIERAYSKTI